jgi:3-oxoacyl-[acyl-carrier protein] reductase
MSGRLSGRRALVTGGSRGLGTAIAEAFLREGAQVLICARSREETEQTAASLRERAPGRIHGAVCDIASEASVESLVAATKEHLGGLDILVANAGIQGPKGSLETNPWEDWIRTIQVNLIGNVYLCRSFLPLLKESPRGKILILSGGGATKPMPFFSAYAASKAGIVRFGETLAEEIKPYSIDVNTIAPGALNTRMLEEVLAAGPEAVGSAYYQASVKQRDSGGASLERAAGLCVKLASSESDGITGRLISAPWDPWERLDELKDELTGSDIYTLRRIIPEDRGKSWSAL